MIPMLWLFHNVVSISRVTEIVEINNRTGFFEIGLQPETIQVIRITKKYSFIGIDGVKGSDIKLELMKDNEVSTKSIKCKKTIFGIDFGKYTGNIIIFSSFPKTIVISYAILDLDCDERKIFISLEHTVDLESSIDKKICIFSSIPGPYQIRTSFTIFNNDHIHFIKSSGKVELAKTENYYSCEKQCVIVYSSKEILNDSKLIHFSYLNFGNVPLLYNGYLDRTKFDDSYKLVSFKRTDYPDLSNQIILVGSKYIVVAMLLIVFILYRICTRRQDDDEAVPLINNDKYSSCPF